MKLKNPPITGQDTVKSKTSIIGNLEPENLIENKAENLKKKTHKINNVDS